MTLSKLNEYRALVLKLYTSKELIDRLRSKAQPQSPQITGMPRCSCVTDKVGTLAAEIADLEERCVRISAEISNMADVEQWVACITDDYIRVIFRLRFIHALGWREVAEYIGGNTEDSVKATAYRYLTSCRAVSPDVTP